MLHFGFHYICLFLVPNIRPCGCLVFFTLVVFSVIAGSAACCSYGSYEYCGTSTVCYELLFVMVAVVRGAGC